MDHDKKKVVISIRGTLSPKVSCSCVYSTGPSTCCPCLFSSDTSYLPFSFPKDALTDLTGDAERLPVEGHRGTWLGHKVSSPTLRFLHLASVPDSTLVPMVSRDIFPCQRSVRRVWFILPAHYGLGSSGAVPRSIWAGSWGDDTPVCIRQTPVFSFGKCN